MKKGKDPRNGTLMFHEAQQLTEEGLCMPVTDNY